MALQVADRVQVTSTSYTTSSFTLGSALTGFQSFTALTSGNTTYYAATDTVGNWEVGYGTYTTGALARTTILSSSNSGSVVTFSGTVNIFITYPAEKAVIQDVNGNISGNSFTPGWTSTTTAAGTTTLTVASSYYQRFVGSTTQTIVLPAANTVALGQGYIIDNDSTGNVTLQDGSLTTITTIVPGMAGFIFCENNSSVAGSWSGYQFVPGAGVSGAVTWGTAGLVMGGSGIDNAVIGANTANTGKFTTLEVTGTSTLGDASTTYIQVVGDASYPAIKAAGGTNTPLVLQPLGTGALQAQQTTSSATGGNARGANAVDWQTNRSAATQVASGSQSVLVGGQYNTSSGSLSFIGGGNANSATGFYNFIGGGYTNTGTSNSAVATQATSTITSGSTAVTLSGSNASIKVGQYITGTPIASGTYVSAISGTSLTLSQNATSSTNATLSFYTPHGVVVAGGNNQATGSYSFIGGGGDAGTAGNRNVASGDWSFVGGGFKNIATSTYDSVVGGFTNNAYGGYSFIGGGQNHNASSSNSSVLGGRNNTANQNYASIVGGLGAYSKSVCSVAQSGANYFSVIGDAQSAVYVLSIATTTTGATPLTTTQGSASTTNQVILPNNQAYAFRALITARNTSTGDAAMWEIKGGILRGSGVGTTALVGTPTVTLLGATTGAITAGWGTVSNVSAVADTTNGGLQITGTGVASTTIHWLARVDTSELG